MADNVTIEGLDEVIESLECCLSDDKLKPALEKACLLVERRAKQLAPKEDGNLRRSITSKVNDDAGLYGIVYTPLFYAPYVEYGTGLFAENGNGRKEVPWVYVEGSHNKHTKKKTYTEDEAESVAAYLQSKGLNAVVTYGKEPQPYLRPALNENREKIKRLLKEGVLSND